jgi:phosphatidylserine/phosphatidylglycerophosphate/cardiolipin synthase-like enzyme
MKDKVVLNTLAHTLGAMHLKMVICGDAAGMRAYVSGLDLVSDRIASWKHPPGQEWHDGGAKVEGPAAKVIYDYYRALWGEQRSRKISKFLVQGNEIVSHTDDTELVPDRTAPAVFGPAKQHVEVLRTLPQMNFALGATAAVPLGCLPRLVSGARQDPLSFAPDGVFEFRLALHKAISAAQQYVYIEDQAFTSFEVMGWLHDRLGLQPNLKIIMIYGADPSDPPNAALHESVKTKLVAGVATPMSNIAFCVRWGIVVHTKITIVDDQWAAIGSANSMRRSLYTDGECSIGVLDEDTPTFAQKLRRDLWGELCGLDPGPPRDVLTSLTNALAIWDNGWGPLPAVAALNTSIERMNLSPSFEYKVPKVLPADRGKWEFAAPPVFDQVTYDQIDGDSRNEY